jgi:hypothetical protein
VRFARSEAPKSDCGQRNEAKVESVIESPILKQERVHSFAFSFWQIFALR